jgi:hypothetical protein
LAVEESAPQPLSIAYAALVRAYVGSYTVFDIHLYQSDLIRYVSDINKKWHTEVTCDK